MRSRNLIAHALGCACVLLLAAACGEAQEMVVIQEELGLREAARDDAPVLEKLPLGTRVKVHPPRFWQDAAWHRVMQPAGMRWTKLDGLSPFPLRGETRFVRLEELPVYSNPDPSARVVETLKVGDELQLLAVEPAGGTGFRGVIRHGALLGFAEEFGLGAEKPTSENLREGAREFLKTGAFSQARQLARAAAVLTEGTGRSGALVDALERAETEPASLREELEFSDKARGAEPPARGATAWVIPSRAHLREGPDLRDTIITVLPADAAVEVMELQPPWAHVALLAKQTPWMAVELGDLAEVQGGQTVALTPARRLERARGYVPISALQAKRLSTSEHLARVASLTAEEHGDQRIELLKRALVLAGPNEVSQVAPALIDMAFEGERFRLAVAAAVRMKASGPAATAPAGAEWKLETVTSIYGCTGHPLESRVEVVNFELGGDFPKPSGNVCARVTGMESPCDVCLSNLSEYDAQTRQHVLRDKVGVDNSLNEHEDVITSHLKAASRLEDVYPRPSRMKVTLKPGTGAPPGRLFVFELPLEVNRYQDKPVLSPSFREARMYEVALPDSAAGGTWEYWLSTLQWEDVAHGALFSSDPKTAWKTMQGFARTLKAKPEELLTRNTAEGVVYSLHVSQHCGKCPTRRASSRGE